MDDLSHAIAYAQQAHGGQTRKYTGAPYVEHCLEVADILQEHGVTDPVVLQAALLHDTVEDTTVRISDIEKEFGPRVACLVGFLTDVSVPADGNRAARKAKDREHLLSCPLNDALLIKCADIISNSKDILTHDLGFAGVYLPECVSLLEGMRGQVGNSSLWQEAWSVVANSDSILSPDSEAA